MKKHIDSIQKMTDNPFLNMYVADGVAKDGEHFPYYFTSRRNEEEIAAKTGEIRADGAVIFAVVQKEGKEYLLLVRQYRFPVNGMVYELPAGLIDEGESMEEAAVRECLEETGLRLSIYRGGASFFRRNFLQAQGICDESNAAVFGYAEGEISTAGTENREDMEVVLADREEVKRILSEETVSLRGAYLMMLFLQTKKGEPFSFLEV